MRLLFIAGSPRPRSRSRILVEAALAHARRTHAGIRCDLLDLARHAPEPYRGWDARYGEATRRAVEQVVGADAVLIGSPVFNGAYSSAIKNLYEHVPYKALAGQVAGFLLVARGQISFLQVRSHLEQLMYYFKVRSLPGAVFAQAEELQEAVPDRIAQRLARLVDELAASPVPGAAPAEA